MERYLYKREKRSKHKQRRRTSEIKTVTSLRMPQIADNNQKGEKKHGADSFSEFPVGARSTNTFRTVRECHPVGFATWLVQICYGSSAK